MFNAFVKINKAIRNMKKLPAYDRFIPRFSNWHPIYEAAFAGDVARVKTFLEEGFDPNSPRPDDGFDLGVIAMENEFDETFLSELIKHGLDTNQTLNRFGERLIHRAIKRNHIGKVRLLVENGADPNPNPTSRREIPPMMMAAFSGNIPMADLLMDYGAEIAVLDKNKRNVLHSAAESNHPDFIDFAFKLGVDIEQRDEFEETPIFHAAKSDSIEALLKLLELGAQQSVFNKFNESPFDRTPQKNDSKEIAPIKGEVVPKQKNKHPIYQAASEGNIPIVREFLEQGFDPNELPQSPEKPLGLIAVEANRSPELLKILIAHGLDVNQDFGDWGSCMYWAMDSDSPDIVKTLLQNNANPEATGGKVEPIVFKAAFEGNVQIIELLVEAGSNLFIKDHFQEGVMHSAARGDNPEMIEWLFQNGVKLEDQNDQNKTPLIEATINGDVDVVSKLFELGANWDYLDIFEKKPYDYAIERGNDEIIDLFERRS